MNAPVASGAKLVAVPFDKLRTGRRLLNQNGPRWFVPNQNTGAGAGECEKAQGGKGGLVPYRDFRRSAEKLINL
jgi:hypothetical protein